MRPSLEDMQVFLEVVEKRTFTAAAEQLGRTKSAVSQAITRLEDDIGTRLLHRSTRSLSLTDAGTRFLGHCRDIRDSYDLALDELVTAEADTLGTLAITAPKALCGPVIVPAIERFVHIYPQIAVRLRADDTQIDLIEAQIDLAVRVGDPKIQSAKISKLGMLHECLYASPGYIAALGGLPSDLGELSHWNHIASDWQGTPVTYRTLDGLTMRATPRIRCNSLHEILQLAEIGCGIARLPDVTASESVHKGALVKLVELGSAPIFSMHLYEKRAPSKVSKFVLLLKDRLKNDRLSRQKDRATS